MRMQEPEQWQPSEQEWQANQKYGEYRAEYSGRYEQEKIHPQVKRRLHGTFLSILAIILSSIGFFLTVAGIVVSAIVLKYANGHEGRLAGGVIGLVGSSVVLLVCVIIFVVAVITLAIRTSRVRRTSAG